MSAAKSEAQTLSPSPNDLDSILDDALDAFDEDPIPTSTKVNSTVPPQTSDVQSAVPLSSQKQNNNNVDEAPKVDNDQQMSQASREEPVVPPSNDDEAAKALEDALRTLGELGLGDTNQLNSQSQSQSQDDVTEADMKLVEEFITSLGESLSGLNAASDLMNPNQQPQPQQPLQQSEQQSKQQQQPVVEKLVESIVGHLLSEDVLKEPMKQMKTAYDNWFPENESKLNKEDLNRYTKQRQLVNEICQHYEKGANITQIMELLSFMQETGAPPDEVMNQLSTDGAMDGFLQKFGGFGGK